MSTLGKLARGIASGLSQYYGIQAQEQINQRKIQALADQQMALESFKSQMNREEKANEANAQAGLERVKADEKIRTEKALLGPKTDAEIKVEGAKLENQKVLEGIKSKFRMDETQTKMAKELADSLTLAKKQIGDARVTADGALVFYSKTGERLGFTKAGGFVPPKKGDDLFDDETGPAAAPRAQAPASPEGPEAPDSGGKTYTAADLAYTAQKNGISVDEARKKLNEAGFRQVN